MQDAWQEAKALQPLHKLEDRRTILRSLTASAAGASPAAWSAVASEALDYLPIILSEDCLESTRILAPFLQLLSQHSAPAHSAEVFRLLLICISHERDIAMPLLTLFAARNPSPLLISDTLQSMLSPLSTESLHQETRRKQALLALLMFINFAAEPSPIIAACFHLSPSDLQRDLSASVLALLAPILPREPSPSVVQAMRATGAAIAQRMPAHLWLPKQTGQLNALDTEHVEEPSLRGIAILAAVLPGLSAVTAELEQLLDVIATKLRVPGIFALMEEDAVYAPEKMPSHNQMQRLWLGCGEVLLAILKSTLGIYLTYGKCPSESVCAALTVRCAALRDAASPWSNAPNASEAADAMTMLARCMGHADVRAYLNKQLMPVLRHLDGQFKEKDWLRPSSSVQALYWLVLCLKHPHAGAYINPLVSLTLRVLDAHETSNKVIAIRILSHLLSETDASQIRWHGELLFETLKKQIVFRELEIARPLLPAITRCAMILELSPGGSRNTELFLEILKELEWNMKRELVALYLAQLPPLIQHNGVHFIRYFSVQHLSPFKSYFRFTYSFKRLFPALLGFFPNASEASVLSLIDVCNALLTHCWPRMHTRVTSIRAALADMRLTSPAASSAAVTAAVAALSTRLDSFSSATSSVPFPTSAS